MTDPQDPNIYADTGANAHIRNNPGIVSNLVPYRGSDKVMVVDGNKLDSSHIGDTSLKSSYGVVPLRRSSCSQYLQKSSFCESTYKRSSL